MKLRTDQISGICTLVFGILLVGFAAFALLIVALQRAMLLAMPSLRDQQQGARFAEMMHAIHGVWLVFLPLMLAGGVAFIVCGAYLMRGSQLARRAAQVNAVLGYAWLIAYTIRCYQISDLIGPPPEILPEPAGTLFVWFSLVVNVVIGAAFPTALLFLLSRPRVSRGEAVNAIPPAA